MTAKKTGTQPPPEDLEYADGHTPATYSDADVEAQRASAGTSVVDAGDPAAPPPDPENPPADQDAYFQQGNAADQGVDPEPVYAAEPENWGYCHNAECDVNAVQLWHPVGQPAPDNASDQFDRPHMCEDLSHPHPVMCQCGHLLQAEPVEGQERAEDTVPA